MLAVELTEFGISPLESTVAREVWTPAAAAVPAPTTFSHTVDRTQTSFARNFTK